MDTDFYALLGVSRDATDEQIKKAYRKAARELHPDANPGDQAAEDKFKQVSLAYEVLRDPERRERYDRFGIDGIRGAGGGGGSGDPFANFGEGMGLGDIFDAFFGGGNSPFGGGGARRGRGGPPQGQDMQVAISVPFETAVFGGTEEVTLRLPVTCDTCSGVGAAPGTEASVCSQCNGAGEVRQVRQSFLGQVVTAAACPRCSGTGREIATPCPTCHGEGLRTDQRTYEVTIPAGIDRGQTLRLSGKGAAGPRGGTPGDLYVHVDVEEHPTFERQGDHLVHRMHVPMTQAVLGAHVDLRTLEGENEVVVVEPGTASGTVHKIRGRGVPSLNGRSRGDLLVQITVDTPTKLNEEQDALLRQFAALRDEAVDDADHSLFGKLKGAFK